MRIAVDINAAEHPQESTENGLFHDKLRHLETQGTRREREHRDRIIVDGQVVRDQDRLAADTARVPDTGGLPVSVRTRQEDGILYLELSAGKGGERV